MVDIISPEIAPCVDPFGLENTGQQKLCADTVSLPGPLADAENEAALVVNADVVVIYGHILKEMHRGIILPVAVHPAACKTGGVVNSGHGNTALEQIGAAQGHDSGMHGSQTAAD